ncbi:MAG: DUF2062 domain-containing protein [Planctomycetes bacterium]|nr:DUF2062 domain-containing protein [Planctomycetota bacterium]
MAEAEKKAVGIDRGGKRSLGRAVFDRFVRPVLQLQDSPRSLALGIAMGLWVALTPTVGIQMPVVVVLGTLMRANRLAAIAMCWISNPVTLVPMYYGYYVCGLAILGREGKSYAQIKIDMAAAADLGNWELIRYIFEVFGTPLWIGSLVIATVCALPAYPLSLRYFQRRDARRREREGLKAAPAEVRPSGLKGEG